MIGQTILHYKILEKLGEGGMGIVYKAEDAKLKRTVALKFLPPELTRDAEAKERFIREAQAASALQHNNICTIHDIDETDDRPAYTGVPAGRQLFIVMDCYEGESLKEKIARGQMKIEDAVDFALQVASGLSSAHEKGIVHRDIKPGNIIVTRDGAVKILDFGLAKLAGQARMTKTCSTVGTAAYMSPEQVQGKEIDCRSDIFSFGVVLYEMLAGHLPFKGDYEAAMMYTIVNEEPEPIQNYRPEILPKLLQIIKRTLEKSPANRYQSIKNVLTDLAQLQQLRTEKIDRIEIPGGHKPALSIFQRPVLIIPIIFLLVTVSLLMFFILNRNSKIHWAKYEAIPEIIILVDKGNIKDAYKLAQQVEKIIPADPKMTEIWPRISRPFSIHTDPQGAQVYWREYIPDDTAWLDLGITPIDSIRLPLGRKQIKIVKKGFQMILLAPNIIHAWDIIQNRGALYLGNIKLDREGNIPDGMVRVYPVYISDDWHKIQYPSFLLDRFEVMNKDYKVFVDSGGYRKKEYWKYSFVRDGKMISWEEAMPLFVDKTGRPGPATWEVSDYPSQHENFPVTGVSWYEAAAYAEFACKQLPTVTHWRWASGVESGPQLIPLSNFSGIELSPAGRYKGLGPYGNYDMAGNAREWCWNQLIPGEKRCILGGGWDDPDYIFTYNQTAKNPFDRSITNGFRCMKIAEEDSGLSELAKPLKYSVLNIYEEKPVSDQAFEVFFNIFSYPKTELHETRLATYEREGMKIEKVAFDAAYGNDRVNAYLFLPAKGTPPFQTIVFFPGSGVQGVSQDFMLDPYYIRQFEFIIKSGRAVLHPVYIGTFERSFNPPRKMWDGNRIKGRDFDVMLVKDLCRSVEYLATRPDIDCTRLAYYGFSWGAERGPLMVSIEKQFKTAILKVGGFWIWDPPHLPEIDIRNYVPRLKLPVLMLNGRYDYLFPYEQSQLPLFNLLGTPAEHKKHVVDNTSHNVGAEVTVREVLAWLDKYLGPVKR